MLVPWSVEMKSKGVWLWEKQINQEANQTEDSWTERTQKINFCITKIEVTRRNYRNERITKDKWYEILCNTS